MLLHLKSDPAALLKQQSILVSHEDLGHKEGIMTIFLTMMYLKFNQCHPRGIKKDFHILVNQWGCWYLVISINRTIANKTEAPTSKHYISVISDDSVVKSQCTWYDVNGAIYNVGARNLM